MEWFSFPSFLCSIHICSQNMPRNSSENAATYSSFVSKFNIAFLRLFLNLKFSQFSCSVVFDSLWPYGLQHSRLPCSSPAPGACSNSCSLNRWCHPTISSSRPLLLPPSIFPSIRVFSNESVLHIRWPKYYSFSISPSNEYSGLISFRMDWLDLLAVQGTLKSLLQHHSSKASILWHLAFFMVQLSYLKIPRKIIGTLSKRYLFP